MRYILIISLFAVSCHSAHKSVNELKQVASKSSLLMKDSSGHTTVDSVSVKGKFSLGAISVDSSYEKVTTEVVKEVIDSVTTRREITRTIKERGHKRVEQSSTTIKNDSTGKKISQGSTVIQLQKQDSTVATSIKQKDVTRQSFLPWWIWLIVLAIVVLTWWKRNPIINFLTGK